MDRISRVIAVGGGLVVALFIALLVYEAVHADLASRANLRRYYPHGCHFVQTFPAEGDGIEWSRQRRWMWRVRLTTTTHPTLDHFKRAFLAADVDKRAAVEVHLPTVKLSIPDARRKYERAQALLDFLREQGYANSGPISN